MKKVFLTTLLICTLTCMFAPAVLPVQQAQAVALPPLSCVTAEEFGWNSPGWNWFCLIELEDNCCDPMGDPWY